MQEDRPVVRLLIVDAIDQRLDIRGRQVGILDDEVRLEVGRLEPERAGGPVGDLVEQLAAEAQLRAVLIVDEAIEGVVDRQRRTVAVAAEFCVELAMPEDQLRAEGFGEVPVHRTADTPVEHVADVRRLEAVDRILERRIARERAVCDETLVELHAVTRAGDLLVEAVQQREAAVRRDVERLVRRALALVVGDVADEAEFQIVVRDETERGARGLHVFTAHLVDLAALAGAGGRCVARQSAGEFWRALAGHLASEVEHIHVTVALLRREGEAAEHVILHERRFERAAQVDAVELAIRAFDEAGAVARGLARHHADGTACRVLAEQRSLRTAQHFDALDVEQIEHGTGRAREHDVVHIDRHAGLEYRLEVGEADAANVGYEGRAVAGTERIDRDVGRELADVDDVRGVAQLQRLARDCRDGERGLLQEFLAEPGGDDDFFETVRCGRLSVQTGSENNTGCSNHAAGQGIRDERTN